MLQSIYTHAGCDYGCLYTYSPRHCFNPHTHAGCDNPLPRLTRVHNRFNPHTHAGCDSRSIIKITESKVSIHTPTQGVTMENQMLIQLFSVSIHTPTQGVTGRAARAASQEGFNPHTHAGCDCKYIELFHLLVQVSIHTPTQGVTASFGNQYISFPFQSTHPRRV